MPNGQMNNKSPEGLGKKKSLSVKIKTKAKTEVTTQIAIGIGILSLLLSAASFTAILISAPIPKTMVPAGIPRIKTEETNFPRLSVTYIKGGSADINVGDVPFLKNYDLVVLDSSVGVNKPQVLTQLKQLNPNIKRLGYVGTAEISVGDNARPIWDGVDCHGTFACETYQFLKGSAPNWWLYDVNGSPIGLWKEGGKVVDRCLNLSTGCPTANGKKLNTWYPQFVQDKLITGKNYWDGMMYDELWDSIAWAESWGWNIDIEHSGVHQSPTYIDTKWKAGVNQLMTKARTVGGADVILVGNGANSTYQSANGRYFEANIDNWSQAILDPTYGYLKWNQSHYGDNYNIMGLYNCDNNYQKMRFGLTTALLGNGYFECATSQKKYTWYDEFGVNLKTAQPDVTQKGYLGQPTGAYQKLSNGIYRRNFANGIVLVNPTLSQKTVTLEKEYRKIKGTQQPRINDGSLVKRVTLNSHDGIILLNKTSRFSPIQSIPGA